MEETQISNVKSQEMRIKRHINCIIIDKEKIRSAPVLKIQINKLYSNRKKLKRDRSKVLESGNNQKQEINLLIKETDDIRLNEDKPCADKMKDQSYGSKYIFEMRKPQYNQELGTVNLGQRNRQMVSQLKYYNYIKKVTSDDLVSGFLLILVLLIYLLLREQRERLINLQIPFVLR